MTTTTSQDPKVLPVKRIVYMLLLLSVITFLTGFLQDTQFGFVIYIFYFILFIVGVKLIFKTLKLKVTGVLKLFFLLTGISSTLYFLFFVIAVIRSIISRTAIIYILSELEGIFYLASLAFIIGALGSLLLIKRASKP
ncbi:MAG: hypothetical protein HKO01_04740 [Flaviramulus sp.]|nr:hypothetical protein [Flaviramulus sp.]NNC49822.1 hypothetical protein [Flaviramulus sp.]